VCSFNIFELFFFHLWFFSGEETSVLAELVSLDGFWLDLAWVLGEALIFLILLIVAGFGASDFLKLLGVAGFGASYFL
jgi:hypothetical protein